MNVKEKETNEALDHCKAHFKEGDTVFTITDHVSESGTTRHIRLVTMRGGDDCGLYPLHPNWMVGEALGYKVTRSKMGNDCLVVRGGGMDMGYHIVDSLSWKLFGEGYKLDHQRL